MAKEDYKIARALVRATKDMNDTQAGALLGELLDYLKEQGKGLMALKIVKQLQKVKIEQSAFTTLSVESPYHLSEDALAEVVAAIGGEKGTPVNISVSSELIGGFIATYQGRVLDASIKSFLLRLQKELIT